MKLIFIPIIVLNCFSAFGQQMTEKEAIFYCISANGYKISDLATWSGNNYSWLGYYCQITDAVNFSNALNDEFKKDAYLQKQSNNLINEINRVDFSKKFSLTTKVSFKEYDFGSGSFNLDPMDLHYNLVHSYIADSELGGLLFSVGEIDNFSDFDIVFKMDRSSAEKFVDSRKDNYGNVNRTIDVKIIFNVVKRSIEREMKIIPLALNAQKILFLNGSAVLREFVPKLSKAVTFSQDSNKTVTDIDGNVYHKILINNQVWMGENLKTTKYRNGELIGSTTPASLDISTQSEPKYQWAYEGNESNVGTYGRLYTWYAAHDSRNICPDGWHLPSVEEWNSLAGFLGGESNAGLQLKEAGTNHWNAPNEGATNSTGFTGLPGGRKVKGQFQNMGDYGYWWSSYSNDMGGFFMRLAYNSSFGGRAGSEPGFGIDYTRTYGYSVRCVEDELKSIKSHEVETTVRTLKEIGIPSPPQIDKTDSEKSNKPFKSKLNYIGEFKDGKKDGKGKAVYEDGSVYDGEWKNDKKDGRGLMVEGRGSIKYIGYWKNDMRDSTGILSINNHIVKSGTFKNGELYNGFMYDYSQGYKSELIIKDGKPVGSFRKVNY